MRTHPLSPYRLVPVWHRSYVRSHPIGLFTALGFGLGGFFGLFFPSLVRESAPTITLPEIVVTLFYFVWLIGGFASFLGILRGVLRLHVAGMVLMAGGLFTYYGIIVSISPRLAVQALFIFLLGCGCGHHAQNLFRCGYEGLEHR